MEGNAIIITHGLLDSNQAKTAHGLVRDTSRYRVLAIIDHVSAGRDVREIVSRAPYPVPIYASLTECFEQLDKPVTYCLVGVAGHGGKIPPGMLETVKEVLNRKMHIVNGLHEYMSDIPEIAALAEANQVTITDIRKAKPKSQLHFWEGDIYDIPSLRIAMLGTDCNLGKRTSTRLLLHALHQAEIKAEMIYTGQTGYMQDNRFGFIFDSTLNDFISGEIEAAIVQCYREVQPDVILLEGQSSLRNPGGPGGSEFLVSGQAKQVVLQHAPARKYFSGYEDLKVEIPSLESEIELIRMYGSEVIALTLNIENLTLEEARTYQQQYQEQFGIPTLLPLYDDFTELTTAIRHLL
ncbi:MAG: DUF1611 domain-containing protein [Cyclobacteriaceae bacterium]